LFEKRPNGQVCLAEIFGSYQKKKDTEMWSTRTCWNMTISAMWHGGHGDEMSRSKWQQRARPHLSFLAGGIFFFYFSFFNHYSRNKSDETYFSNLVLFSHVNLFGVTYEGVTLVHLAWLKGLARAWVTMLAGIVPRRISHTS
jgi:hypothetical protein